MTRCSLLPLLVPAFGFCAFASAPLATVTSALPFNIDGHSINTPGVTSFPLVLGDAVATSLGPAVLIFQDGSAVKLGIHSSVKICGLAAKPKLVLVAGALDYRLVPGSDLAIANLDGEHNTPSAPKITYDDAKQFTSATPVSINWANPRFLLAQSSSGGGSLPLLSKHR